MPRFSFRYVCVDNSRSSFLCLILLFFMFSQQVPQHNSWRFQCHPSYHPGGHCKAGAPDPCQAHPPRADRGASSAGRAVEWHDHFLQPPRPRWVQVLGQCSRKHRPLAFWAPVCAVWMVDPGSASVDFVKSASHLTFTSLHGGSLISSWCHSCFILSSFFFIKSLSLVILKNIFILDVLWKKDLKNSWSGKNLEHHCISDPVHESLCVSVWRCGWGSGVKRQSIWLSDQSRILSPVSVWLPCKISLS